MALETPKHQIWPPEVPSRTARPTWLHRELGDVISDARVQIEVAAESYQSPSDTYRATAFALTTSHDGLLSQQGRQYLS
jgi:hypothetical protein